MLPPIFKVMKAEETELRASAISLLSIVAETEPYPLLPHIQQIADYIHHLLVFEEHVETRRGAVALIVFLFQGLGFRALRSLPSDVLKTFYRDLSYIEATDQDSLTKGHAKVALLEINDLVKGLF